MNQVQMTGPEYDRLLNDLKAHITQEVKTIKSMMVEKPMTYQEAADFLNIHINTLYKRIREGDIPSTLVHKNNGSVYFFPSELHQFIKKS